MSRLAESYAGRLLIYAVAAVIGSAVGSLWTWTSDAWVDANPLISGPSVALFSLGPTIAVLAAVRLSLSEVAAVATLLAVAMIGMWYVFAGNDSSTSALIFIWGWLAGLPAAAAIVWLDGRRSQSQRGPSQTGPAGQERSDRAHAKAGRLRGPAVMVCRSRRDFAVPSAREPQ
ncbi:hypothetical protein [Ilumatobacter coccineus]|uniref:Uncharacterized protein n=1 Tax=Ilumatobacter coccineus (strain NBRC 103263 / KCTC 29153 / YM16-304) TaxID=1313172 RepID=A0A6C7E4X2_ILUCY|nr:hypothetical protein [Ilumatobacter coccineus]BAN01232.1 hypothetical protein YM304_09180 [Ilumatobacter coccineus YM16-304]